MRYIRTTDKSSILGRKEYVLPIIFTPEELNQINGRINPYNFYLVDATNTPFGWSINRFSKCDPVLEKLKLNISQYKDKKYYYVYEGHVKEKYYQKVLEVE